MASSFSPPKVPWSSTKKLSNTTSHVVASSGDTASLNSLRRKSSGSLVFLTRPWCLGPECALWLLTQSAKALCVFSFSRFWGP